MEESEPWTAQGAAVVSLLEIWEEAYIPEPCFPLSFSGKETMSSNRSPHLAQREEGTVTTLFLGKRGLINTRQPPLGASALQINHSSSKASPSSLFLTAQKSLLPTYDPLC